MHSNSILRLGFIVGNGQASSFNTNLYKLICAVLYYSKEPLSYSQIADEIKSEYELSFIEEEIEKVINAPKYKKDFLFVQNEFISLTAKKINSLKLIESKMNLTNIIQSYIKEKSIDIPEEYLLELLTEFLYKTFSLNKQVILDLLNHSGEDVVEQVDMDNNKKHIVNDFLNWQNKDKDIYIFNTISYCVDYCQLTIKKDSNTFSNIFNGKRFYLDTNVIFRLIGFNNDERKRVMNAFVERCKECGITLLYTNFTYQEVIGTIQKHVLGINKYNRSNPPVEFRNYKFFMSRERNLDFIKLYCDWAKQPGTKYNDYKAFEKYLLSLVNNVLKDFKKSEIITYKVSDRRNFDVYTSNLSEYKKQHSRQYTNVSIECDVNNFMYVWEQRRNEKGDSAFNINNYFVSTDSRLCDWSSEIVPGSVPICVLPSVWYSLILKYRGRTDNDYRAFSLFLNMRYRFEPDLISDKKEEILAIVQSLDEPKHIKDKILDDIRNEISGLSSVPLESAKEFVQEKHNSLVKSEVDRVKAEYQKNLDNSEIKTLGMIAEKDILKRERIFNVIVKIANIVLIVLGTIILFGVVFLLFTKNIKSFLLAFVDVESGIDFSHYFVLFEAFFIMIRFTIITPIEKIMKKNTFEDRVNRRKDKLIEKYKG